MAQILHIWKLWQACGLPRVTGSKWGSFSHISKAAHGTHRGNVWAFQCKPSLEALLTIWITKWIGGTRYGTVHRKERSQTQHPQDCSSGASLVAQWLRILLPMQGTWVRSLVREDPTCRGATKPVCHNYWACARSPRATTTEPACCDYWSPHA